MKGRGISIGAPGASNKLSGITTRLRDEALHRAHCLFERLY